MRSIAMLSLILLASVACNLSTSSDTSVLTSEPSSVVEIAETKPENTEEEIQTQAQVQQVATKSEQTTSETSCVPRNDWPLYVVISGDTLGSIAQRTNTTVNQLAQANCLANIDQISVSQQLRVPRVPASNPQTGSRSYSDANTGVAFDYPSSWYVTPLGAGVELTSYEPDNLPPRAAWTDAIVSIDLTAPSEAAGLDIPAWAEQEKQLAGPVPIQEQTVTLTIGTATKLTYASGAGGTLIEQYYLRFNGRNIRIVVANNLNNPLVSGVLNSLRSA